MALPVRPHPDAAPRTQPNRVLDDVVTASASGDPCLEFAPEEPDPVVRQPVFVVVPSEAPRYVAEVRPQDQFPSRRRNVSADAGPFRTYFRRVLLALRRRVTGTRLYRGVTGTLALDSGMVGALLALQRCAIGTYVVARWMTSEVAAGRGVPVQA